MVNHKDLEHSIVCITQGDSRVRTKLGRILMICGHWQLVSSRVAMSIICMRPRQDICRMQYKRLQSKMKLAQNHLRVINEHCVWQVTTESTDQFGIKRDKTMELGLYSEVCVSASAAQL